MAWVQLRLNITPAALILETDIITNFTVILSVTVGRQFLLGHQLSLQ